MALLVFGSCSSPQPDEMRRGTPALSIKWKKLGQLPGKPAGQNKTARLGLAGPVTGITGDYLIIGGGSNFPQGLPWEGGVKRYYSQLYIYELRKNPDTTTLVSTAVHLPYQIGYPACVSTDKAVLVAGGENSQGPLDKVLRITMDEGNPTPRITELPPLPQPSTAGMAAALGDKLYFAGGNTAAGTSDQFLVLDLRNTDLGWHPLPNLPQSIGFGVMYAYPRTGELFIASGRKRIAGARTPFFSSLFVFNTTKNSWQRKADLPYPVSAATGIRFQDKLFIFGGDPGETFHLTEDLLLKIAGAKDSLQKKALVAQKDNLQMHHPGFTDQILIYDPSTDKWARAGKLSHPAQVTTTAIPWQDGVIIPCGEIRAGVRYPDIIEGTIQVSDNNPISE